MLRYILLAFVFLAVVSSCKDESQKPATTPVVQPVSGDTATIDALRMQVTNAQASTSTCNASLTELQVRYQTLCNQIAGLGQTPAASCTNVTTGAGVIPVNGTGVTNNSTVNSLIQTALGLLKPQAGGSCGPSGSNCCTPNAQVSCVGGTTTAIYCNAQGTNFETRVVSGQCGQP